MFLQNRFCRPLAPGADLAPSDRFGYSFRFPGFSPQKNFWAPLSLKKQPRGEYPKSHLMSSTQPGRDERPQIVQRRPETRFS